MVDADVAEEMERMKTRCLTYTGKLSGTHHPGAAGVDTAAATPQPAYAMEMYGLRKEYGRGLFRRKPFVAVRSSWLGVLEGAAGSSGQMQGLGEGRQLYKGGERLMGMD